VVLAAYIIGSYVYLTTTADPPRTTFQVVLGIFILCLSIYPFSQALVRRPHPESIEVRDDALVLRFPSGRIVRRAWEDRPVEFAYDARKIVERGGSAEGMDVRLFMPEPGRREGTTAFRPMEVEVSGDAFEAVKREMAKAGFRAVARKWSRRKPGDLVEFLARGEEEKPLPPEIRAGLGRLRRDALVPSEPSEET
jgi:hypothetical protein